MKTKKNLVLVGMMGSGKSTIGNIISKKLDFEFIDTDYEIEKYEKISIKKIFDDKGEGYFRKLEETIILKSINLDNKVISLGGGGFLKFLESEQTKLSHFFSVLTSNCFFAHWLDKHNYNFTISSNLLKLLNFANDPDHLQSLYFS